LKKAIYIAIFLLFSSLSFATNNPTLGQNYPNPATGTTYVNVDFNSGEATLTISNVLGKSVEVLTLTQPGKVKIDVKELINGIYFLTLEADGDKITKKMTVKK